jgi:hypothetical protein
MLSQGRFAAARRPENANEFTLTNPEVDIAQDRL